jgi:glycine dehydrogenase subunit 1
VLLIAVVTEMMSLGAVKSPGEMGADIVVGEGQSIGNGLNFGGPYVGFFATREKLLRQTPGRYCGMTTDADGKRGFVLTLSTREQHIRRDKATSNICTNSGLCALAFTVHMTLLGEAGLRRVAMLNHQAAVKTADALATVKGVTILTKSYFNEFTVRLPKDATEVVERLAAGGVLAGVPGERLWPHDKAAHNLLIVAATECVSEGDIEALTKSLVKALA